MLENIWSWHDPFYFRQETDDQTGLYLEYQRLDEWCIHLSQKQEGMSLLPFLITQIQERQKEIRSILQIN